MKYRLMAGGSVLLLIGAAITADWLLRAPATEPTPAPEFQPPAVEMPTHREQLPRHLNPENPNPSKKPESIASRGNSEAMTADFRKFTK